MLLFVIRAVHQGERSWYSLPIKEREIHISRCFVVYWLDELRTNEAGVIRHK